MTRYTRTFLTIGLAAALLVPFWLFSREAAAPTASGADPSDLPRRGGELIATTRTDPRSFNRLVQPEIATEIFSLLTQGRLVRINRETQAVEPWLAERWDTSADGRVYTLYLRNGLEWSDGTPFTAADVLFTFEALYDPRTASPLATVISAAGKPLSVASPDPRTVVVTFPEPFGPGIRLLDMLPIMPRHKLEAAQASGTFAGSWAPDTPPAELVSLGPFILATYQPAQRLVFERNPRYWRRDERGTALPYVDRLTVEIVPDQETELVRLQAGQSDFMQQALRPGDVETLRPLAAQGRVQVVELGVSLDADTLLFNLRPERWRGDDRAAWLAQTDFRRAISHAVDREAFADTVFLGAAVPVHGPVTPGNTRWFWPSIPRYEFSRSQAGALLSGLGLANRDQDEWLEDAGGRDVRFTVLTFRGNAVLERGAAVLRDDLRHVGVAVDVVALEPNTVRQRVVGGDFDAAFVNFSADPDPAMSKDFWLSSGSAHFWHPRQPTPATEWERQLDDLMRQQESTVDDEERRRIFNEMQRLISENLPVLHFAAPRVYLGASARLTNLSPALTRPPLMWSADTLALKAPDPPQ